VVVSLRAKRWLLAIALAAVLGACATPAALASSGFDVSKADAGTARTVCGVKAGAKLLSNTDADARHYEIVSGERFARQPDGPICVTAKVVFLGCQSGPEICVDWSSDFGLDVISIENEK
jgi:hypothetical protein